MPKNVDEDYRYVVGMDLEKFFDTVCPLLSNIMLNELDKELTARGHRLVRYADSCMIFCKIRDITDGVISTEQRN